MHNQIEFIIKKYNSDPEIDFDKVQADIYNSAVQEYTANSVSPDDLKKRTENDKFDKEGMLYAFTKSGKPLAYIRYHHYPGSGEIYIGYPWSVSECPREVQETLLDNLKRYVKKKYPDEKFAYMGFADDRIKPFHDFANSHGFVKDEWTDEYMLDVEKAEKNELKGLGYREVEKNEVTAMVEVCLKDKMLKREMGEEQLRIYHENKVLKDGNAVFLLKGKEIIGATAVLRGYRKGVSLTRFKAIDENYASEKPYLYIALAKLLVKKGLTDEKLLITEGADEKEAVEKLKKLGGVKTGGSCRYRMEL